VVYPLQSKAFDCHRIVTLHDEMITVETLRNKFIGKADIVRTITAVFADHNKKKPVGQGFEKNTLQRYETCLMHIKDSCNGSSGYWTCQLPKLTSPF